MLHKKSSQGHLQDLCLNFIYIQNTFLRVSWNIFMSGDLNASPGVRVYILVLSDVHVESPGAGHDVILLLPLLGQAEAGQGGQQRAWLQRRGDSAAGGSLVI